MNAPGRLVLVLGMHRSGTSTLARGLRVLGVALGKNLLPAHPCNPKGFFEDAGLYAFNKALLAQLGLTWRSPEAPDTAALRRPVRRESRPWGCCAKKAPDRRFWASKTRA